MKASRQLPWLWAAVACTLALASLSFLNLVWLEFGPWRHIAIDVDELYFSSCAVRGLAAGEVPISGCHDSKAPMIFVVHQMVQLGASPYSLTALKAAAFGVVTVLAALTALLAFRLSGAIGAAAAAALLLLALTTDTELLALKTETVGTIFILLGASFLIEGSRRPWTWLASGVFLGLAAITKQTFAFAVLAVMVWSLLSTPGESFPRRLRSFLLDMLGFGTGLVAPFLAFLVVFLVQGTHEEYLASLFLYPSVYGSEGSASWLASIAWRAGDVLSSLGKAPLLVALLVVAIVSSVPTRTKGPAGTEAAPNGRRLVAFMTLAMIGVTFVSPVYFDYHLLPAWVLMAVLGGVAVADFAGMSLGAGDKAARFLAAGLTTFALLMAATSWYSNGGRGRAAIAERTAALPEVAKGQYAYVLGMWPSFYVYNDLVPASRVMFPWALPGAPANWAYRPPDPASLRGRALAALHRQNLPRLFEDFRRTPPKYIVVIPEEARDANSTRVADVPGFDEYVQANCVYMGPLPGARSLARSLYRCN